MDFPVTILYLWLTLFLQCGALVKSPRKFQWPDRLVASVNEFPYIVSIQIPENPSLARHFCAGVIISEYWVLTAANCLDKNSGKVEVFKGRSVNLHTGWYHQVDKVIVHPNFKPTNIAHPTDNIAVLHVKKSLFHHNPNVSAIALGRIPDKSEIGVQTVGWSARGDLGIFDVTRDYFQTKLRELSLQTMDSGECRKRRNDLLDKEICVVEGLGKMWCSLDAGNPLITKNKRRLVGIGNLNRYSCNNEEWPALFVRLSVYIDWLRKVTGLKLPLD